MMKYVHEHLHIGHFGAVNGGSMWRRRQIRNFKSVNATVGANVGAEQMK